MPSRTYMIFLYDDVKGNATVCMFLIISHIKSIAALTCCHKLRSSLFEPGQEILIMLLTETCSKWLGKWHGTFEVFKKL